MDKLKKLEFDFIKEYNKEQKFLFNRTDLIGDPDINYLGNTGVQESIKSDNRTLAQRIITWYIQQYQNKWDMFWSFNIEDIDQSRFFFSYDYFTKRYSIEETDGTISLPIEMYFSPKVKDDIIYLPLQLALKYKVDIFKYWLTGER